MPHYVLTEEGRRYLKEGLPEKNLVAALSSPLPLNEAQKRVEHFTIALSWAKKNGWIAIRGGMLVRLNTPGALPEEAGLQAVAEGRSPDRRVLETLLKRNLVRKGGETAAPRPAGNEVGAITPEMLKTGQWKTATLRPYNVAAAGVALWPGKQHPYRKFLWQVRQRLVEMGFQEMSGPAVELEFWNFDALYQPQNHPSRDWTDTYSLKSPTQGTLPDARLVRRVKAAHEDGGKTGSTGWGYRWDPAKAARLMPRAHTTAHSARQLAQGVSIPGKYFSIQRNYRPDVIDATHGVEFYQTEGIVVDESLTFRSLLGILRDFAVDFAGVETVRFYPDYYPFTEPSVQMSARHPEMGWIEFGGAGIFRPELTLPLGVEAPVIAWGLGIDRLAMYKLGIADIRQLFTQDLAWLRNQPALVEVSHAHH